MMKKWNSLTVLFIATALMVLLMLLTVYNADDNNDDFALLFPDLYSELSDVDNIEFKSSQGEFSLHREGEDWFLKEHHNYPANFNEVKRMLIDLSEAKILERKTDNPEELAILGVEGADEGGESLLVSLRDGDKEVAGLILGRQRELADMVGPQQYYVRRKGEERSWLAEGYFTMSPIMLNWIDAQIMDIARERIARVEIIQPTGDSAVLINLGAKDKFGTPEDLDKTIFKYQQLGYDIAGSTHQMHMEDVQPAAEFTRGDADVVTAKFTTFDGLVLTAKTSYIDGFYYSSFTAEYVPSVVTPAPEDIQALDVLKTAEQVQAEAQKLSKRLSPWVYQLSGFVGTNLMRAKDDMVTVRDRVIPMPSDMNGFGPLR